MRERLVHPCETLSEFLEERDMSASELSMLTGLPEPYVSSVLRGEKGMTTQLAERLGPVFGTEAEFWLRLQRDYDIELAGIRG